MLRGGTICCAKSATSDSTNEKGRPAAVLPVGPLNRRLNRLLLTRTFIPSLRPGKFALTVSPANT